MMNVAEDVFGEGFANLRGDSGGRFPLLGRGMEMPAHFQHLGMVREVGRQRRELGASFLKIAQSEPAFRGINVPSVCAGQRLHAGRIMGPWVWEKQKPDRGTDPASFQGDS